MKNIFDLIARILISVIFVYEGIDSIIYYKDTKQTMSEYGINWAQDFLLIGCIVLLILGGLLILIGYRAGLGSVMLLLYWVPITLIVYSFWNDPPDIRRVNAIMFMKNIAIIGALLMILVNGSGKYGVKRLLRVTRIPGGET